MEHRRIRRGLALMSIFAVVGLTAAACAPTGGGGGPATHNFTFGATSVTVNSSNDYTPPCIFGVCLSPANDEPYVIDIGFTVKVGQANSATDAVVVGDNQWSGIFDQGPGEGDSASMTGSASGAVTFPNVPLLDVGDLLNTNNHLEIAGVWSWAMEADLLGVSGIATTAGDAIKTVLNSTLATGSLPSDPNALVSSIIGVLGNNIFPLLGSGLASIIPFAGDDAIGSRFYVGLGVTGSLKTIVDAAVGSVTFPSLTIPVLSDPPDIDGGAIFSLGAKTFSNQVMTNGGVQGQHTYTFAMTQS
jgi:hypothetical protein